MTFEDEFTVGTFGLYGKYVGYEAAFLYPNNVTADESAYLLEDLLNTNLAYADVVDVVKAFDCGVFNHDAANNGKTIKVELVIWKGDTEFVLNKVDYTFAEPV